MLTHHHRRAPSAATASGETGGEAALPPGTLVALAAMGLGILVIANDFTALNVALPAIEEDFDVDVGTAQWVVNAYALVFGMAIVTGGRLADMFGRRRVFFIGAVLFAGFSLLGAAAQSAEWLIATRVGMGIGGAMMWPAILGLTYAALPASRAGIAGGLILGIAGFGNAVGPLIGGVLTDELSWRWIFLLNVPIAAFAIAVTYLKVREDQDEAARERVDYAGIAALSLGLLLLLLGFDQAADWGWGDARVVALFAASLALIAGFGFIEPRVGSGALIPPDVARNRGFVAACIVVVLFSAVFFASVLYGPQFMEKILDYSALEAGFGMLPMLGSFALVSFAAGPLYERLGPKITITAGAFCCVAGPVLLALLVDQDSGYGALVPGLTFVGIGIGLYAPSVTTAGVTALGEARASLAGGLIYMSQIAGGAIGLGVTTAIFTTTSESELGSDAAAAGARLSEHQESVLHGLLAGTDTSAAAAGQLDPAVLERIEQIVRDSFVSGFQAGMKYVAAVALVGFFIALFFVGGRLRRGHATATGDASPGG